MFSAAGNLEESLGAFGEMVFRMNDGSVARTIQTRSSADIGHSKIDSSGTLNRLDLEDFFFFANFDGCARMIEELSKHVARCSGQNVKMLEWLLAQLYRNDDNLSMLTATLTGAVRENYDGLKMGMEHIRSIENIVTHGNVQASNARRNIVDGKQKLVTDMLRILLTRRRRCRLREIHTLARSILDLVKASTDVYEAMVATDFTTALVLSDYARLSLEKPNLSKFVVLDTARRQICAMIPALSPIVDNAAASFISDNTVFDESKYFEIISACAMLDTARGPDMARSRLRGVSKQIASGAISRIEDLASKKDRCKSVANLAIHLSTALITFIKLMRDAAAWHANIGINNMPHYPGAYKICLHFGNQAVLGWIQNVGRDICNAIGDIWCRSRHVIIGAIAADISGFVERRSQFSDVTLALEALEAASLFAASTRIRNKYADILKSVSVPYFNSLRSDILDGLRQMLSCESWIHADACDGHFPGRVLSGTVVRAHLRALISGASAFDQMLSLLNGDTTFRWEARIAPLFCEKGRSTLQPILNVTQTAIYGVQRSMLQCVRVAALLDGISELAVELIYDIFEIYLKAVAVAHLSPDDDVVPSCGQISSPLIQLIDSAYLDRSDRANGTADLKGAIVAGESLRFVRDMLFYAVKAIFECELLPHPRFVIKNRLAMAGSLATELRVAVYRGVGLRLVDAPAITGAILSLGASVWLGDTIQEECNLYVHEVIANLKAVWLSLNTARDLLSCDSLKELVWTHVVQATFEAFIDGFARVSNCSTEGRALMSMDLQVLHFSLDEIQRIRPPRGAAYVDSYIKAWYFDEPDLQAWIMQNEENYHKRHLDALRKAHFSKAHVTAK